MKTNAMLRLADKTAIITGGAGHIGQRIASLFVDEGAQVMLVDQDEQSLAEAVSAVGNTGLKHCVADVSTEDGVRHYIEDAKRNFGKLDILILNAGREGVIAPIVDYPVNVFDSVMAVNVRGVWLGLKHAIPIMSDGGSIVVASSISGVKAAPEMSAYGASKHAVIGLVRGAAVECAGRGLRVNAVGPGPIDSRMMQAIETGFNVQSPQEAHDYIASRIPLNRYGRAEEVAKLMLFLASDDSGFCTGGVFMMDGGITAK